MIAPATKKKLEKQRGARLAKASARDGVQEGHFRLHGQFVRVWLNFYPNECWMVCDAALPRGEDIDGTARKLSDDDKRNLTGWL
jgi:hypothetical protein